MMSHLFKAISAYAKQDPGREAIVTDRDRLNYVELKNQLIQQGRYTDCVDELIFKVANAPVKRMKIEYV